MSALGHKRTLERLYTMSALPPKADIRQRELNIRMAGVAPSRFRVAGLSDHSGRPAFRSPSTR
jgi:hypothetical protein